MNAKGFTCQLSYELITKFKQFGKTTQTSVSSLKCFIYVYLLQSCANLLNVRITKSANTLKRNYFCFL